MSWLIPQGLQGEAPPGRGGHAVASVGSKLIVFGACATARAHMRVHVQHPCVCMHMCISPPSSDGFSSPVQTSLSVSAHVQAALTGRQFRTMICGCWTHVSSEPAHTRALPSTPALPAETGSSHKAVSLLARSGAQHAVDQGLGFKRARVCLHFVVAQ